MASYFVFFRKDVGSKRVFNNKGSRTPGIDGVVWRSPTARMKGALKKYFRRSKRYSAVFHACPEGRYGEQNTIDLIRMAEITRVRYIKIKGKIKSL